MTTTEQALITIDISDESILWMCDKCNVRQVHLIADRQHAILEMRSHRESIHGRSDSWRMNSTRNNHYDYRI